MISKVFNRIKRAPVSAIAVLLFAAVISIIICALHASNEAELQNFEEVSATIPVKMTVTNLTGTDSTNLRAESWILSVFTGRRIVVPSLDEYVKDVHIMSSRWVDVPIVQKPYLRGITSLSCDRSLLPEYGCVISWKEGYDESIFDGEELVCIIPEDRTDFDNGNGEAVLRFSHRIMYSSNGGPVQEKESYEYQCTLKIVGTFSNGDDESIYCPYPILEQVYTALNLNPVVDTLSATLADNSRLEEFREKAAYWFVDPSPIAQEIPWGRMGHEFYPYALDIDDEALQKTVKILQSSIRFNQTCTVIVFVLSAVAGFLVGFLMIRNRKRDITLMRTIGESDCRIYFGFAIEQMICIVLGIAFGGSYNMWDPMDKLLIFGGIYFVGLSLALVIFLRKNLLTTIKEDE